MAVQLNMAATGQSNPELGQSLDISLQGTWVGTVKLQRKMNGAWVDTGDSWTANVETAASAAGPVEWRVDFTRTSGTVTGMLTGTMGIPT